LTHPLGSEPVADAQTGCGRFFEGTAEEMHKALNKTLAALPDETKVYVSRQTYCYRLKSR